MAATNPTLWGIHAGRAGDADHLFLTQSVIALGWMEVGDFSKLTPKREAFKARLSECYPDQPVLGATQVLRCRVQFLYRSIKALRLLEVPLWRNSMNRIRNEAL